MPRLASQLIGIFALALGLTEEYFDKVTSHPDAAVALNYYPTLPKANEVASSQYWLPYRSPILHHILAGPKWRVAIVEPSR